MASRDTLSLYIHIPFCRTRCAYCDFNTTVETSHLIRPYIESLLNEIEIVSKRINEEFSVETIYFGGGTPNLLSGAQIGMIINKIRKNYQVYEGAEISMEINPSGLTRQGMDEIRIAGVNRISLGMQSAQPQELKMLGRRHEFQDVITSVSIVRRAGIENINLDLIFGLPGQKCIAFEPSLDAALDLRPPHLSLYALTVEEGTPLAVRIEKGELPMPDEDEAGDMYAMAMDRLSREGYIQYEISNWVVDERHQCMHNVQYWRNLAYIGFGASAHSHNRNTRWENIRDIQKYINSPENTEKNEEKISPFVKNQIINSQIDEINETMMMGLRLTEEGISDQNFQNRFGLNMEDVYKKEIQLLLSQKLIEWAHMNDGQHLRLTQRGKMLGNQVFLRFIKT